MKRTITLVFLTLAVFHTCYATVVNVPAGQPTIQAGLNAALTGDTVLVQPGTYAENITWPAMNGIVLLSAGDSSNTIIDGNNIGRVISITSSAIDTTTVIRGFSIINGVATANPTGAGMYISAGSPLVLDCCIRDNTGNGSRCYGAGIVLLSSSQAVFRNCAVVNNQGLVTGGYSHGGGFFVSGSSVLTMEHCVVSGNSFFGGTYCYGAGIFVTAASVVLTDVRITDNHSDSTSYNYGPALHLNGSTATLDRVFITRNKMVNSQRSSGGGIYATGGSTINVTNTLIAGNILSGGTFNNGGGIYLNGSFANLMNVTIADNVRADGGSITGVALDVTGSSNANITNSILWNTGPGTQILLNGSTDTVTYSDVYGGATGTGNISTDPLFVGGGDYHLQDTSLCLNAGTPVGAPPYDLENNMRPAPSGTFPDMGAYEKGCTTACLGWLAQNCTTCQKGCYIDGGIVVPSGTIQTSDVQADTGHYGYVYWAVNLIKDSTYYFDLCASTGTSGISWLRVHNDRISGTNYCMDVVNTPTLVYQNENNGCAGTGTGLSKIIWTCPVSGTYYLESAAGANRSYWGLNGSQTATLSYKILPSISSTCPDVFYDKGIDGTDGSVSSYNNNEDWIYTYYPADTVTDAISVQFVSFSTTPGDILCVYDGNSINAPIIGCYSGPSITGSFSSTASNGALTFHFTSDDSLISGGWQANVTCIGNVGVRNYSLTGKIKIYPNPMADGNFTIDFGQAMHNASVKVFNVMGEEQSLTPNPSPKERGIMQVHLDVPAGIYFVKVIDGDKIYIERLIVQ